MNTATDSNSNQRDCSILQHLLYILRMSLCIYMFQITSLVLYLN